MIYERLEGWWFKKQSMHYALMHQFCKSKPSAVFIVAVSQEYADDNLPIDVIGTDDLQESSFSDNEKSSMSN